MTTELATIKKALQGQALREYNPEEIRKPLAAYIARIYALRGQTATSEELRFMATELGRSVFERFPGLSLEEVGVSLDKGVKGDFGEYYGLSVVTFLDWVRAYQSSNVRIKAQEELAPPALPQQRTITEREFEIIRRENALRAFTRYKQERKRPFVPGISVGVYDTLDSRGILRYGKEEKLQALEKAKETRREEIISDRSRRTYTISKAIEKLGTVLDRELADKSPAIVWRAKELLLLRFFDSLIEAGKDLETLYPEP